MFPTRWSERCYSSQSHPKQEEGEMKHFPHSKADNHYTLHYSLDSLYNTKALTSSHLLCPWRTWGHLLMSVFCTACCSKLYHFEKCTWGSSTSHADPVIQLIIKHKEELSDCLSMYIAKWNQSQALEQKQTFPTTGMNKANSFICSPLFNIRKFCS